MSRSLSPQLFLPLRYFQHRSDGSTIARGCSWDEGSPKRLASEHDGSRLECSIPIELEFRQTGSRHAQTRGHPYAGRIRSAAQSPEDLGLRADAPPQQESPSAPPRGALSPIRLDKSRRVSD
jgi:hypothetical protein